MESRAAAYPSETVISDGARPVLLVIGGPNGAGKTSLTQNVLKHDWAEGCLYINPDEIAKDRFGDWNCPDAVISAARFAQEARERCVAERKSLAFETVMSGDDKIEFIRQCKEAGYFVRLFFVGTESPTINAARVAQRVLEGGHDVPIPKIISRYSKSIANCLAGIEFSDRAYIYDNSVTGQLPRIMFRTRNGVLYKQYGDVLPWAQNLLAAATGRTPGEDVSPVAHTPRRRL